MFLTMTSIEACFIIIAADLPTLRPVFLHFTGGGSTTNSRSSGKNRPSYRLDYLSDSSASRVKKEPKDLYPTGTLAEYESHEHILPANRIRRTDDVDVDVIDGAHTTTSKVAEEYIDRVRRFGPQPGLRQEL